MEESVFMKCEAELQKNVGWIDRSLFWCFCSVFFFIPLATSPAVIAGCLALGIWLFSGKFWKERQNWLNQKWTKPVIVFALLPWTGLLWSNDISTGLHFAQKSYYWLYAFAIASTAFSVRDIRTLLNSFIAGLLLVSTISWMQFAGLIPFVKGLPTILAWGGKYITLSLLFVFGILVLSFYFSRVREIKYKRFIIFLMLYFYSTLFLSPGRIGYLTFGLLSPLIIYNLLGQRHIIKIAAITTLITGALFLSPTVQSRVALVTNDVKSYREMNPDTSVGLRLHVWKGAIRIFLENPIFGTGTGGYQLAMKKYETPQLPCEVYKFSQPHNSFLYMAANFGMVGLSSLFWLFGVLLKNGWQNRQHITGFSILTFTLVLLIGSLTDTQILSVATGMLFALLTGLQKHLPLNET